MAKTACKENFEKQKVHLGTFFNVTVIFGAVTLHGIVSGSPSIMCIVSGISLCSFTNG